MTGASNLSYTEGKDCAKPSLKTSIPLGYMKLGTWKPGFPKP